MTKLYTTISKMKPDFMTQVVEETGKLKMVCDVDGTKYGAVSLGGSKVDLKSELLNNNKVVKIGPDDVAITYIFKKTVSDTHNFDLRFPLVVNEKELLIEMEVTVDYDIDVTMPIKQPAGVVKLCKTEASTKHPIIKTIRSQIEKTMPRAIFGIHYAKDVVNAIDLNKILYEEKVEKLTNFMDKFLAEYGLNITVKSIEFKWKPSYLAEIEKIKDEIATQEAIEEQLKLMKEVL